MDLPPWRSFFGACVSDCHARERTKYVPLSSREMNNANSRMPAVLLETVSSHASIYNAIKAGLFTKPVRIGQRAVGWPSDEVGAINAARIAGLSYPEIRDVVAELHAKRVAPFT